MSAIVVTLCRIRMSKQEVWWTSLDYLAKFVDWYSRCVQFPVARLTILPFALLLLYLHFANPILRTEPCSLVAKLLATTLILTSTALELMQCSSRTAFAFVIAWGSLISSDILAAVLFLYCARSGGHIVLLLLYVGSFLCWYLGLVSALFAVSMLCCIHEFFIRLLGRTLRMPICKIEVPQVLHVVFILVFLRDKPETQTRCLVCMEEFEDAEPLAKHAGCTHVFHRDCLIRAATARDEWNWVCPACLHSSPTY